MEDVYANNRLLNCWQIRCELVRIGEVKIVRFSIEVRSDWVTGLVICFDFFTENFRSKRFTLKGVSRLI